jgi:hypothetical protein
MKKLKLNSISLQEKTIHAMILLFITLVIIYCAILISIVFSVIERKQNMISSVNLSSQLSSVENKYSDEIASIDNNFLVAHNFTHFESTTFAIRKDNIASYAFLYEH